MIAPFLDREIGKLRQPGEELEVEDRRGRDMEARGLTVEVEAVEKPPKDRAVKRAEKKK